MLTESRPQLHGAAISVSDRTLDALLDHLRLRTCRRFSQDWPIDQNPRTPELFTTGDREFQTAGAVTLNAFDWKLTLVAG